MDTRAAKQDLPLWLLPVMVGVGALLLLRTGFLSSLLGLGKTVSDTASKAITTIAHAAADIDPWNKKGKLRAAARAVDPTPKLRAVGRAIDVSRPIKGVARNITGGAKSAAKSVKRRLRRIF